MVPQVATAEVMTVGLEGVWQLVEIVGGEDICELASWKNRVEVAQETYCWNEGFRWTVKRGLWHDGSHLIYVLSGYWVPRRSSRVPSCRR